MKPLGITRVQNPICVAKLAATLAAFDSLPACAGVTIPVGCVTTSRSRASIYRDIAAGRIEAFKINGSTRLRVGSLRKLLSGTSR